MRVRIELEVGGDDTRAGLQAALDATCAWNARWLLAHPHAPGLYESGVVYRREPRGYGLEAPEDFATIPVALRRGWGDCDDLAPWLAAELRVRRGIYARPVLVRAPVGWHVVVETPDGLRDPSADLGMRGV